MNRNIQNRVVIVVFALVMATFIAIFCPVVDSVKRDESRAQTEYASEIEAIESDLESRDWIAVKIPEGQGVQYAYVKAGLWKELGSQAREVCDKIVRMDERNINVKIDFPKPGDVIYVPVGTKAE